MNVINKKIVRRILYVFGTWVLSLIWPSYMRHGNEHSLRLVFRYWFIQKIMRINPHVPWPVHPTSRVIAPEKILRGTRTPGLATNCHIDGRNGIIIEENVWIGPRVSLISMNHELIDFNKFTKAKPIIIRKNCWIATNAIILAGVEIGEHTVIAAGAVVTKSFLEGNQILAGNPAKIIKKLEHYHD